jgi:hypothetical protein
LLELWIEYIVLVYSFAYYCWLKVPII